MRCTPGRHQPRSNSCCASVRRIPRRVEKKTLDRTVHKAHRRRACPPSFMHCFFELQRPPPKKSRRGVCNPVVHRNLRKARCSQIVLILLYLESTKREDSRRRKVRTAVPAKAAEAASLRPLISNQPPHETNQIFRCTRLHSSSLAPSQHMYRTQSRCDRLQKPGHVYLPGICLTVCSYTQVTSGYFM